MSDLCPCGSGKPYAECCEPAIKDTVPAKTAEALMRSRYTAYVKNEIEYLGASLHPDYRQDWDLVATKKWAQESEWLSLKVIDKGQQDENSTVDYVEFITQYKENGVKKSHHEISRFMKIDDHWFYVDGNMPRPETFKRTEKKVGRNDPCPCGSGKKYKKCCGK